MKTAPAKPGRRRAFAWALVAVLALAVAAAWRHYGLGELLTFEQLKASRDVLAGAYEARPLATVKDLQPFSDLADLRADGADVQRAVFHGGSSPGRPTSMR